MKINFDVAAIQEQRQKLNSYANEMKQIKNELQAAMQQLTTESWKGAAANAFKSAITDDWCDTVDRYCDLMTQLCTIIDRVTRTYEELQSTGERLRIEE